MFYNMMGYNNSSDFVLSPTFLSILIVLVIWEMVWKGLALWKAGKNKDLIWFILILILNTAGILPIIYLIYSNNKEQTI